MSMKVKVTVTVTQLCLILPDPVDCGILQARILQWVASLSLLQGIFPTQEVEPRSPALQADSLLTEPQGKSQYVHVEH